ncbi:Fungal Zn(2)-Cys(6) binuclear cluster domain-containing protein [Penicillium ucsense]|uniref:Fungal Zn(2)-Cys(6) binuclear cluster domain-containing protein n=1 Tax=Penicillium ucsense TaxID=2839758 RepID=A0A8J8VXS2_9EURO|nr:Fungal Zn(2)-Cys(6) binuclear cluster domain-containing protein [Penicillium ucsense]KAF7730753.1 Fungal Zn(2)-Cys(6) binuclear cluster domain-containing protein [Penicillium ucsense]
MGDEILRACDTCHSRKVRCDRRAQCANCVDAGIECLRLRPERPSRPQKPAIICSLGERLLRLEKAVTVPHKTRKRSPTSESWHVDLNDSSTKKRKSEHSTPGSGMSKSPPSQRCEMASDETTHHAEQARVIIQSELDGNGGFNRERQMILKSALQFVNSLARQANAVSEEALSHNPLCDQDTDSPRPCKPTSELLLMLLREYSGSAGASGNMHWPDHISAKSLRKIVSKFLSGDLVGQEFYQYSVCIHVRAILHTMHMPRVYQDPIINEHLLQLKKEYTASAMEALRNLNFLNGPSLPFIQALVSATLLMLLSGRMSQAWVLNSFAARLISALGYHDTRRQKFDPDPDRNEEIKSSVYWCFFLDRTLGCLLHRSLSLPELNSPASDLVTEDGSNAHMPLVRVLVDLAQVQGELSACSQMADTRQIVNHHTRLQENMAIIFSRLQSSRNLAPDLISRDWIAIEFSYYAILVEILRSRLRYAFSPLSHKECLCYSRKAVKIMQYMLEDITNGPGFVDPFPSWLTWTLLLYPLSPFFVLFCNIIGEVNTEDYQLLQNINQSLSHFTSSPHIAELVNLLQTLQDMCTPLIQSRQSLGPGAKISPWYPVTHENLFTDTEGGAGVSVPGSSHVTPSLSADQMLTTSTGIPPVTDDLMWHLFNSQPSLQWGDPDIIASDPAIPF